MLVLQGMVVNNKYMNTFYKVFLVFTIVAIFLLSTATIYQWLFVPKSLPAEPVAPALNVDQIQQAITMLPDNAFVSGQVSIKVDDFMNEGNTFEDPMNPGNYILSGDIGYCIDDGACPDSVSARTYSIWFDGADSVFFIRLLEQPINTARLDAERFLQRTLNLTAAQLCEINYYMSVSESVSREYAGQHLQFSTCAGSQKL